MRSRDDACAGDGGCTSYRVGLGIDLCGFVVLGSRPGRLLLKKLLNARRYVCVKVRFVRAFAFVSRRGSGKVQFIRTFFSSSDSSFHFAAASLSAPAPPVEPDATDYQRLQRRSSVNDRCIYQAGEKPWPFFFFLPRRTFTKKAYAPPGFFGASAKGLGGALGLAAFLVWLDRRPPLPLRMYLGTSPGLSFGRMSC